MGSCGFQCNVLHQWISQRQVSPVSVYCDGVGCHTMFLLHCILVWQHNGQSTTPKNQAPTRYNLSYLESDVHVKPKQRNKTIWNSQKLMQLNDMTSNNYICLINKKMKKSNLK